MQQQTSPAKAAATFLLFGSFLVVLTFVAWGMYQILITDILKTNPHRSIAHALTVLPLMSAIAGVITLIVHFSGAIILAGCVACMSAAIFGRVPLWILVLIVVLCVPVVWAQDTALPDFKWYSDLPDDLPSSMAEFYRQLNFNIYLFPSLLGCWLKLQMKPSA